MGLEVQFPTGIQWMYDCSTGSHKVYNSCMTSTEVVGCVRWRSIVDGLHPLWSKGPKCDWYWVCTCWVHNAWIVFASQVNRRLEIHATAIRKHKTTSPHSFTCRVELHKELCRQIQGQ